MSKQPSESTLRAARLALCAIPVDKERMGDYAAIVRGLAEAMGGYAQEQSKALDLVRDILIVAASEQATRSADEYLTLIAHEVGLGHIVSQGQKSAPDAGDSANEIAP